MEEGRSRDAAIFDRLDPAIGRWWRDRFGDGADRRLTPPQRGAIPHILDGEHVLVAAPTGSGKTLASFTAIIDDLLGRDRRGDLADTVYCLYVSPLKSLANDIHRNLSRPLEEIAAIVEAEDGRTVDVRHAIRHGDTDDADRRRMLEEPPHILNTTPETLAILLNAPSFREHLRTVEYVIVDEIHDLAAGKRGSHLAVSLERLESLADGSPVRIGCSATIEPIDEVASFLVGCDDDGRRRSCEIVDRRFSRTYDIELVCPCADLVRTPADRVRDAMYDRLHALVREHESVLVFTNTRSGAERVLHELRDRYPAYDESNSGCHHGSLAQPVRERVEADLKAGTLDVVTTSTSLELGIDMPDVDLVVQLGSPKSTAALLQRFGRAGHQLGETVAGRLFVLDRGELLECVAMLSMIESGTVDRIRIPRRPHDVAVQHVYGMAIAAVRPEAAVRRTLRRAYPFRDYSDADWSRLLRYLTAAYDGLTERHVYPKVWVDANDPPDGPHHHEAFPPGTRLLGKRGRLARPIYMTNVGTIPGSFACTVRTREADERVGSLDETFLDAIEPGDVFLLGGRRFAFRYRRGGELFVDPTDARPTVPTWFSEQMPLAVDVGRARLRLQHDLAAAHRRGGRAAVRERLASVPMNAHARGGLTRLIGEQLAYAEAISTPECLLVEEERDQDAYRRRYYVHATFGRRVNDGLARLVAEFCRETTGGRVTTAVDDGGFTLSMPLNHKVDVARTLEELAANDVRARLRAAIEGTDIEKRYFRINATRSFMILQHYKGKEKSPREQQVSSEMFLEFARELEDFVVLAETHRELLEDYFDVGAIEGLLEDIASGAVGVERITVDSPSPLAFGLATLAASATVIGGSRNEATRAYHRHVLDAVDDMS